MHWFVRCFSHERPSISSNVIDKSNRLERSEIHDVESCVWLVIRRIGDLGAECQICDHSNFNCNWRNLFYFSCFSHSLIGYSVVHNINSLKLNKNNHIFFHLLVMLVLPG